MRTYPSVSRARASVRGLVLVLAGLLAASPVLLSTSADAAEDDPTVGISVRTAGPDGAVDTRTRFSYQLEPGQSVADQVVVSNTGTSPQTFRIVGTDALNDDKGDYALLPTDEAPTGIGQWVRFENDTNRLEIPLDPGQSRVVPFTLALPADAGPGDHAGGILASVVSGTGQVAVDRRVGIRMYARVAGELQPQLSISGLDATFEGDWWNPFAGSVVMRYTVQNAGNVALAANVTAGVSTWFGIPAAPEHGGSIKELLPNNSVAYEFTAEGAGQWLYLLAHLTLQPYVDSSDADAQLFVTPVSRDAVVWAVPWLLIVILVAAGLVLLGIRWRNRREADRAQEWMDYTRAQAREEAQRESALVGAGREDADDA